MDQTPLLLRSNAGTTFDASAIHARLLANGTIAGTIAHHPEEEHAALTPFGALAGTIEPA